MNAASGSLSASLAASTLFPFQYDAATEQVLMIALSADAIANAAFLDQRVLASAGASSAVTINDFEAAAASLPDRSPALIFHQGHCGSTLLSRLIATSTASRAFREPLVLRTIAALAANVAAGDSTVSPAVAARRLTLFLRCLAQGSSPAVVKASSICGDLAQIALAENADARALFLFLRPEVYIATMLAGPNNRVDLAAFGGFRRQRLRDRGVETEPLYTLSPGRLAALAWLCEAIAFSSVPNDQRLIAVDFDAFLSDPVPALQSAARHLGLSVEATAARAAVEGPDMRTYSKAQQHEYSPALRAEVLRQARWDHAGEIKAGLDWLAAAAARSEFAQRAILRLSTPA
jgi:hypothetical protein